MISGHGLTRAQQFCHIGAKNNFEVEFKLKPFTVLMAIKSVKKPFTEKKTMLSTKMPDNFDFRLGEFTFSMFRKFINI